MKFQRQKISRSKLKKQLGFVSGEVIIVVIVVIALVALGASKIGMLSTGSDTTEELSNIQALYASTKSLKSSQGYGASEMDLTSQLLAVKGVPKNMAVISGTIYNLFSGPVIIKSTGPGFSILTSKLPPEVCIKLVTKVSRSGVFAATTINSNGTVSGEVDTATATAQCNGSRNDLLFSSDS